MDTTVQQNIDSSREEHLIGGREIHMKGMRAYRFCEVGLIAGECRREHLEHDRRVRPDT